MSAKINIKWLGHSCFKITKDGYNFITDPYEPNSVPGLKDVDETANAVYCSHEHFDHNWRDGVKITENENNPFKVTEIHSFHDDCKGEKRGKNIIRIFESDGIKIVHYGDIGCGLSPEEIALLSGADAVMIPVGGFYTIDSKAARAICDVTGAKVVIPMHYKGSDFGFDVLEPLANFLDISPRWVNMMSDSIEIGKEERNYTAVLNAANKL